MPPPPLHSLSCRRSQEKLSLPQPLFKDTAYTRRALDHPLKIPTPSPIHFLRGENGWVPQTILLLQNFLKIQGWH